MIIFLQTVEIVDKVQEVIKNDTSTVEGLLLAMCILLGVISWLVFKYFNKELRRQEEMYREEIKDKDNRIREAVKSHLEDAQRHTDDLLAVNKDTNKLIEELRKIYNGQKVG